MGSSQVICFPVSTSGKTSSPVESDSEEEPSAERVMYLLRKAHKKRNKIVISDPKILAGIHQITDELNHEALYDLKEARIINNEVLDTMDELVIGVEEKDEQIKLLESYSKMKITINSPVKHGCSSSEITSDTWSTTPGCDSVLGVTTDDVNSSGDGHCDTKVSEVAIPNKENSMLTRDGTVYVHKDSTLKLLEGKSETIKSQVTNLLHDMNTPETERDGLLRSVALISTSSAVPNEGRNSLTLGTTKDNRSGRKAIVLDAEKQRELMSGTKKSSSQSVTNNTRSLSASVMTDHPKRNPKMPVMNSPDITPCEGTQLESAKTEMLLVDSTGLEFDDDLVDEIVNAEGVVHCFQPNSISTITPSEHLLVATGVTEQYQLILM